MSNTGDKNNYSKPMTLTGSDTSGSVLYIYSNSSNSVVIGHDAMKANTTGSSNIFISNSAELKINTGFSEEDVDNHLKSYNVNVILKNDVVVIVTIYEYMKIKNLVENEGKKLSELTKEDFDMYLVTIKV